MAAEQGAAYFSLEEVKKHSTKEDCWTVVHGRVYDITPYLQKHPGGFNLLFKNAGGDSTADFEGMFHSRKARQILEDHFIGVLEGGAARAKLGLNTGFLSPLSIKGNMQASVAAHKTRGQQQRPPSSSSSSATSFKAPQMKPKTASPSKTPAIPVVVDPSSSSSKHESKEAVMMSPNEFRPFRLQSIQPHTHDTSIFRFVSASVSDSAAAGSHKNKNVVLRLPIGSHLQVRARLPTTASLQAQTLEEVTTAYTPILLLTNSDDDHVDEPTGVEVVDLLVKRYEEGPQGMSRHIHSLRQGDLLHMRGPNGCSFAEEYSASSASWKDLVLIGGGTGITPMLQVMRGVLHAETNKTEKEEEAEAGTRVTLICCHSSDKDVLLRKELERWEETYSKRLRIYWFTSRSAEEKKQMGEGEEERWFNSRLTAAALRRCLPSSLLSPTEEEKEEGRAYKVLYCGPPSFNEAVEGMLSEIGIPEGRCWRF